jgi:hypothetical protein
MDGEKPYTHCLCFPLTLSLPITILKPIPTSRSDTGEGRKKFPNALIDTRIQPSHGHRATPPPFSGSVQQSATQSHKTSPSPKRRVLIKPIQLLASILDILLSFHAHIENRTIATGTDNLIVHAALAALTLRPQS